MTRVLITGANSYIGTNVRRYSQYPGIEEVSLLSTKPEDIDFGKYDTVLHLAAIVHQSKRIADYEYFKVNRDLCLKVAEYAEKAGIKQFLFLSTSKVYGKFLPGSDPWNEISDCNPEDAYGRSKYEAEVGLKNLENSHFIVSIIRTPLVYGPGSKANMLRLVKLIEKYPLLPLGKVDNNRNYTYVENLVGFIDRIIEVRASGTFIAMDDHPLSTTDLVLHLSKFLNKKIVMFSIPEFLIKTGVSLFPGLFDRLFRSLLLENTKTKEILKFKPAFTSEDGLRKMISFYLENRD